MKNSKYNYIIDYDHDNCVLFNGLTLSMIQFDKKFKSNLKEILSNPHSLELLNAPLKKKLFEHGFIINDNENEINKIIHNININSSIPKYTITISPTYECNFSCWYCIQRHEKEYMSIETVESIKKHLTNYLVDNNIKIFEIHWFGGEPLLCFNSHIKEISEYAMKICEQNEVVFINNITTNGYLINKDMAMAMSHLKFQQFQITIDGCREFHNKTRNQNKEPSFDKILNNIKILIDSIPDVNIFLRFNFTKDNLDTTNIMIKEINEIIDVEYRKLINVTGVKVWQVEKDISEEEPFRKIYNLFSESGYNIADVELNTDFMICDAAYKHSNVFFHNGNVDKCNNIKPNDASSKILATGDIIDVKKKKQLYNIFSSDSKCINCKHLPICLGPCLKCLRNMSSQEEFICIENMSDQNNLERIKNYCRSRINNKYRNG